MSMNIKDEINKKANTWLNREKEGLNIYEKKDLEKWLNSNSHNKNIYEENKRVREACSNLPKDYLDGLTKEVQISANKTRLFEKIKPLLATASILFILCFGIFKVYSDKQTIYSNTYITKNENLNNIILADNTRIDLDVKSQIAINLYKNKRQVTFVKGKAMFSVAKDKNKPFIIRSGKTTIEVVGTQFEVINLNDITTINVSEGIVKIAHIFNETKNSKTITLLKKGDTLSINNQGKVLNFAKTNIKNIATWRENLLVFTKTTLSEATKIFQRYSDKKTSFQNNELSQLKISGSFSTKDYDKFLHALPLIYPIKVHKNMDKIQILKKN